MTIKVVIQSVEEVSLEVREGCLYISQHQPMENPEVICIPFDRVIVLADAMLKAIGAK